MTNNVTELHTALAEALDALNEAEEAGDQAAAARHRAASAALTVMLDHNHGHQPHQVSTPERPSSNPANRESPGGTPETGHAGSSPPAPASFSTRDGACPRTRDASKAPQMSAPHEDLGRPAPGVHREQLPEHPNRGRASRVRREAGALGFVVTVSGQEHTGEPEDAS